MKTFLLFASVILLVALMMSIGQLPIEHSQAPLGAQMQRAVLEEQDLKEIQRIIKAGFKINDPIGCGTFNGVDGAVAIGNVKILKFFLANGAQPKGSALLQAVWCRKPKISIQMVEMLLKAGADPNYRNCYMGDTNRFSSALHVACSQGHFEVVKLLLSQPGVELNAIDIDGRTPLMWAGEKGHEKIVGLLLAKGAKGI